MAFQNGLSFSSQRMKYPKAFHILEVYLKYIQRFFFFFFLMTVCFFTPMTWCKKGMAYVWDDSWGDLCLRESLNYICFKNLEGYDNALS